MMETRMELAQWMRLGEMHGSLEMSGVGCLREDLASQLEPSFLAHRIRSA